MRIAPVLRALTGRRWAISATLIAMVFGASFLIPRDEPQASPSSELGIAAASPAGEGAGLVIPASCPSSLHASPDYGKLCTRCNLCGDCNNGTYQCGTTPPCSGCDCHGNASCFWNFLLNNKCSGTPTLCHGTVCSVSAPANPPGVGVPCTNANACGQTYPATTICSGTKTGLSPLNISLIKRLHNPPCSATEFYYPGGGLVSPGCYQCVQMPHYPSDGIVQCDGSCTGIAPPLPSGYGTVCQTAGANICGMHGTGIIGCSGTCEAAIPPDSACTHSLQICGNSCSSGIHYADGSSFAMMDTDPARQLVACYSDHPACTDTDPAANVSAASVWNETSSPDNAVTLSGSDPRLVTPITLGSAPSRSELLHVSYSGLMSSFTVAVVKNCVSNCASGQEAHCMGETFSSTDSCGNPESCTGTRYCDFNWKEVAP